MELKLKRQLLPLLNKWTRFAQAASGDDSRLLIEELLNEADIL